MSQQPGDDSASLTWPPERTDTIPDAPKRIDDYQLLEPIGTGGMGIVYRAEQLAPVRRIVALKLIKLGMDTRDVVARFSAEKQALAILDHPAIAKVFDAGASELGRPYFVMEYVPGESITQYCDRQRLSTRERLELFAKVCLAVQHAHYKGIVHRDLKPGNVLVVEQDGRPAPKVIDFGVAKAIDVSGRAMALTQQGAVAPVGTPAYMSPEQAVTVGDVDTRADVYSLGVILYELLTGSLPLDPRTFGATTLAEWQRVLESRDAKPPSRLSDIAVARELRGDLDCITMKALAKDRDQRYGSAAELAEDVGRVLDYEPIRAAPASGWYRARKFVLRHRMGVAAGAAITAALLVGIVGTSIGYLRAERARRSESEQRARAQTADAISSEVNRFLNDMLISASPRGGAGAGLGHAELVRDVLDRAATKIDGRFPDQPLVEASIRNTIGCAYHGLGEYTPAEAQLAKAYDLRLRELGSDHADALVTEHNLATVLESEGKLPEAERLYVDTLARRRRTLGDAHRDTLRTMRSLATFLNARGRTDEAAALHEESIRRATDALGPDDPDTLAALNNLAGLRKSQGKLPEALSLYRDVADRRERVFGAEHPDALLSLNNVAVTLDATGKPGEAEPILRDVLNRSRNVLGPEHSQTLTTGSALAGVLTKLGRTVEAEQMYSEVLMTRRRTLGDRHPDTLATVSNLATVLERQGKLEQAAPLWAEAYAAVERGAFTGAKAARVAASYGLCLAKLQRVAEAEAVLTRANELFAAIDSSAIQDKLRKDVQAALQSVHAARPSSRP